MGRSGRACAPLKCVSTTTSAKMAPDRPTAHALSIALSDSLARAAARRPWAARSGGVRAALRPSRALDRHA